MSDAIATAEIRAPEEAPPLRRGLSIGPLPWPVYVGATLVRAFAVWSGRLVTMPPSPTPRCQPSLLP